MELSENAKKIRRMSGRLRLLFQFCTYALPFPPVLFWLGYNHLPQVMRDGVFIGGGPAWLAVNSRLIALLGCVPATVLVILALIRLKRLFTLYEQGIYFQAENVVLFRQLGKLAFWSVLADVFEKTGLELARTFNNPPGQRVLSIGLSGDHLRLMVVAVLIILIGMVIDEARKIHDEHELTV